mgnify:CR=1 FL=1
MSKAEKHRGKQPGGKAERRQPPQKQHNGDGAAAAEPSPGHTRQRGAPFKVPEGEHVLTAGARLTPQQGARDGRHGRFNMPLCTCAGRPCPAGPHAACSTARSRAPQAAPPAAAPPTPAPAPPPPPPLPRPCPHLPPRPLAPPAGVSERAAAAVRFFDRLADLVDPKFYYDSDRDTVNLRYMKKADRGAAKAQMTVELQRSKQAAKAGGGGGGAARGGAAGAGPGSARQEQQQQQQKGMQFTISAGAAEARRLALNCPLGASQPRPRCPRSLHLCLQMRLARPLSQCSGS